MATTNETESTLHFWILSANWAKQRKKRETKKRICSVTNHFAGRNHVADCVSLLCLLLYSAADPLFYSFFPLNILFLYGRIVCCCCNTESLHTHMHSTHTHFKCYWKRRRRRKTRLQLFRKRHTKIVDSLVFSSSSQIIARIRVWKNH